MSEGQGIGVAGPLAALGLIAAAMLTPPPVSAILATIGIAALTVPVIAGCFSGNSEPSCGWTHPEREKPACRQPALAREAEQPGRNWAESTARDKAASHSR